MTDPIADMLTRIRNAIMVKKDTIELPSSKIKTEIASILKEEGYIKNYKVTKDKNKLSLQIYLKYQNEIEPVIHNLTRVSKPGGRVYCNQGGIPLVMNGLGIAIVSTSKGILTDKHCREQHLGGEVMCFVW